jgi:hypothetical protein
MLLEIRKFLLLQFQAYHARYEDIVAEMAAKIEALEHAQKVKTPMYMFPKYTTALNATGAGIFSM